MGVAITQIDFRETLSRFRKANSAPGSLGYWSGVAGGRPWSIGDGDTGLWAKEKLVTRGLVRSWALKPGKMIQGPGARGSHEGAIVNFAATSLQLRRTDAGSRT